MNDFVRDDEYLKEKDLKKLADLFGKKLLDVYYYLYHMGEDDYVVDYIALKFEEDNFICLTAGSMAENIKLIIYDRTAIINHYNDETLLLKEQVMTCNPQWDRFRNKKLLAFIPIAYKEYCHTSLVLFFEDNLYVEFYGGVDDVNVEFDQSKIGCLGRIWNSEDD